MQVETFEVTEETATGKESAADPQAIQLIESLGLTGQEKFVRSNSETGAAIRAPYRLMTTTEYRVYKILMPECETLEKYGSQMIPLRVLQVAAHAKELGMFRRLEVWHNEGKDDPLLIGSTDTSEWRHAEQRHAFLLARWGNLLQPFNELFEEAKKTVAAKFMAGGNEAITRGKEILSGADILAEVYFRTGKFPDSIYFNA